MKKKKKGARTKIGEFLIANMGQVVTSRQIQKVSGITSATRRLRELRDAGWPIQTDKDVAHLKPGEYCLTGHPPENLPKFSSGISARLRAEVLERNGFTCQMCGAAAGDKDHETGRKVRLHIGHITAKKHGGKDELSNLKALCSSCNQGAKNITQEPPRWAWLLSQIRRAKISDQKKALKWLKEKFEK